MGETNIASVIAMLHQRIKLWAPNYVDITEFNKIREAVGSAMDENARRNEELYALRAQLTEKDREIARLKAKDGDHQELRVQFRRAMDALESSQARERDAVERAEKAERTAKIQAEHAGEVEKENLHLESALAAARKALEKIAEAPGDNIGVWCRSTAIKALEFPEGHKPGCRYGEPPTTFMDGGYPCTCGYRAALNGDSHA